MAEALAKTVSVHIILLFHRCLRIKLLPECYRVAVQHSAPVGTDFIQNLLQSALLTKHIQFKEIEIRRSDLRNLIIVKDMLQNLFLLFFLCNIKKNCKNIGMSGNISSARCKGINICSLFLIPEIFLNYRFEIFILFLVCLHINLSAKHCTCLCHNSPAGRKQHLFCAEWTILIHICPVNIYPVFFLPDKESMFLSAVCAKFHQRFHFRIDLSQKFLITVSLVMLHNSQNP